MSVGVFFAIAFTLIVFGVLEITDDFISSLFRRRGNGCDEDT